MNRHPGGPASPRVSARLRLALSYAVFLVAAGFATLFGVYLVLRYVPNYPLTAANPRDGFIVASRAQILHSVLAVSGYILGALAVIGVTGGWFLAGWILRPLRRINEAAQFAAAGRLDHRIRLVGRNDEFRQVADSFDFMLEQLDDAFATQERFAANASHELRTPLAVTETLLEVARKDPGGQDYATLIDRLSLTNARAIHLTEALLRLADTNAITAVAESVDLAAIVRGVVRDHAAAAAEHEVTLDVRLDWAPTVGDATLLTQLVANLVQNAIHHNRRAGLVRISTQRDASTVILQVENTGTRYTQADADQLVEPFVRGSGRVSQPGRERGHGLGLAMVARITAVHRGTLTITARTEGGLDVIAALPARTPS